MSDIRDYMTLVEQADAESVEQDEERTLTEDGETIEITSKGGKIGSFKQSDDAGDIRKAIRKALEKYAGDVKGRPGWVGLSCCPGQKMAFKGDGDVDSCTGALVRQFKDRSKTDEQAQAAPAESAAPQPAAEPAADEGPALTRRDFAEKFKEMEAAKLAEQSGGTAPKLTGYSEVVEEGGEPLSVQRFEEYFSETEPAVPEPVTESADDADDDAAARRRFAEAFNEE